MLNAVVFDFYGTLAHWADGTGLNYVEVLAAHGYAAPPSVLDEYFARYDGIAHAEHSIDEGTYEVWVRSRLRDLAQACHVNPLDVNRVVGALRAADQEPMVAYPEAATTLARLREAGLTIGVCSNWGWELDAFLKEVGLLDFVDSAVTSARAGARKPHPDIYTKSAQALETELNDILFVGDSWEPDVRGPRRMGMTAVHVWRKDERPDHTAPTLEDGDHRIGELSGVLDILGID
jgi:putative hydrolase of the HAD superfamily